MDVEIKKKVENPLLKRDEIECIIDFEEGTPNKEQIKEIVARALSVNSDLVVINKLLQQFGLKRVKVVVNAYKTKEAMAAEPEFRLKRGKKEEKKEVPEGQ